MTKNESSKKLTRKQFWLNIAEDASVKIKEAKKRVKELEQAREGFRRNAENEVPIPGEASGTC
jgi:hypothetical protein